jgi:hypothetical protein
LFVQNFFPLDRSDYGIIYNSQEGIVLILKQVNKKSKIKKNIVVNSLPIKKNVRRKL